MKILFDFITLQSFVGGGAAYTNKILITLCEKRKIISDLEIIGLFDSKKSFIKLYNLEIYCINERIRLIDINSYQSISQIIQEEIIDNFFIGIGQTYRHYDLSNVNCHSVMVIHDIYDYEINDNRMCDYLYDPNLRTTKGKIKHWVYNVLNSIFGTRHSYINDYSNIINFYKQPNVVSVTVSEYSKFSLNYYFPELNKPIQVLYSPNKVSKIESAIENPQLLSLINSNKRYYLLVSANRLLKNAKFVIETFRRVSSFDQEAYLVTIGYKKKCFNNHIILPSLSDSDLENAYKNAYALIFASLEEGFGYPPLEVMKYGVPVICSNVCSMPEILGDSALYFSPFYKNDLYCKVVKLSEVRELYVNMAKDRSRIVSEKQKQDLEILVNCILGK